MAANDPLHGKEGGAVFGAVTFANVLSWTITLSCALADSTEMHATNTGRTRVAGFKTGTASVECLYNANAVPEVLPGATAATLKLQRDSGTLAAGYYTGTAASTGYVLGVTKDDIEIITYNFVFQAAVTIATA